MFYRVVTSKFKDLVPARALAKVLDKLGFGDYYEDSQSGYFELKDNQGTIVLSVLKA